MIQEEITIATQGSLQGLTAAGIADIVNAFIASQDINTSSRNTYARALTSYLQWVKSSGRELSQLALSDVIAYKDSLMLSGKTALTISSYINSVRRFYSWTESMKLYPNIAKGVRSPKRAHSFRKQPLSQNQVSSMLNLAEMICSKRDYAILNLMLRTGLRCVEVVRANVMDITFIGGQRVLYVQGKGHTDKDDFVVLTDAAYNPIARYLQQRGFVHPTQPLFMSDSNRNSGERLTTRTVSSICKKTLKAVGLNDKAYTAHSLRHTAAVNILRAGGTIEQAQFTLRHSSPATTQIYTETIREEQRLTHGGELLLDRYYMSH